MVNVIFIRNLHQIQLLQIFQRVEVHEKSGLLTFRQSKQEVRLYFQRGRLIYTGLLQGHEHVPVVNGHLQSGMSRGQSYAWAKQEVAGIVQDLLSWPEGEVYFDEGVQPPTDRFLLDLPITLLLPSLFGAISTSNSPISDPDLTIDGPSISISASSSLFKTPRLTLEMTSNPTTPPAIPATQLPFLFKKSKFIREIPDIPTTPFPQVPITPLPVIEDQVSPSIRLPQASKRSMGLLSAARAILPLPDYDLTVKLSSFRRRHNSFWRWEVLLIVTILLIAGLVHGFNMFHFPYFEDDEGTYMSQAWAVINEGQLAHYTFWYDHAPLGWLQIAAWTLLTGGFHTFGPVVNSGRVLMFLMQIASTFMLYRIARSISHSVTVAMIASLLFALSPYGIYFHRRVLLDNISTFWMLLSLLLLVSGRLSLKRIWLSAIALAISILSKELTVFLFPIMTYLVFFRADKSHRWLATIGWVALVVSIVSLYPLMAILKNELFPSGTLLGGTAPHVSLLGTLQFQASRGKDGGFFNLNSLFWQQTKSWLHDYPILVGAGSLCAILSVLVIQKHRLPGIMGLLTLSLWVFLGRGGEVIGFYIVPLLPLLALNIGLAFALVAESVKNLLATHICMNATVSRSVEQGAILLCLVGIVIGCLGPGTAAGNSNYSISNKNNPFLLLWSGTQADAQNQATQWIEKHLPVSSRIIIDESMWTDLYDSGYRFADYYWKVQEDPAIRDKVYHNNWRNFDYVVTTIQMLTDMRNQNMVLVVATIDHSTLIASFDTGGWPVQILKVNTR